MSSSPDNHEPEEEQLAEGTLMSHLLELRSRLMKAVFAIVIVLIFGTKRIKALASGFGGAAKTFREAATDVPAPRQAKLDNAEPDAEFPERRRGDRA